MGVKHNISTVTKAVGKGAAVAASGTAMSLCAVFAVASVATVVYGVASGLGMIDDGSYGVNRQGWFSAIGALATISVANGVAGMKLWQLAFGKKEIKEEKPPVPSDKPQF